MIIVQWGENVGRKMILYWNFVQAREISLLNFHCNKTGTTDFKSAVVQVEESTEILATGNMFILEIDETKANPYYVQALFDSELGRALFKSIYVGSVIPTIPLEKLRKLEISLPSPEEQNIIGGKYKEELGRIADLKEKLSTSIKKLKQIYNIKNILE